MLRYDLTETNRVKVAKAFAVVPRVDLSFESVVEHGMGQVFVDDAEVPAAYRLSTGAFHYFAGDSGSPAAGRLLTEGTAAALLMPSGPGWLDRAVRDLADRIIPTTRYSFTADSLDPRNIRRLLAVSPHEKHVLPVDEETAARHFGDPESFFDLSSFPSPEIFSRHGIGYWLPRRGEMIGVAYSSLVCSPGIEISIFVHSRWRRSGVATALASRLLLDCIERGLEPHWDAANPESCLLARKLGYEPAGEYRAYYVTPEDDGRQG